MYISGGAVKGFDSLRTYFQIYYPHTHMNKQLSISAVGLCTEPLCNHGIMPQILALVFFSLSIHDNGESFIKEISRINLRDHGF